MKSYTKFIEKLEESVIEKGALLSVDGEKERKEFEDILLRDIRVVSKKIENLIKKHLKKVKFVNNSKFYPYANSDDYELYNKVKISRKDWADNIAIIKAGNQFNIDLSSYQLHKFNLKDNSLVNKVNIESNSNFMNPQLYKIDFALKIYTDGGFSFAEVMIKKREGEFLKESDVLKLIDKKMKDFVNQVKKAEFKMGEKILR